VQGSGRTCSQGAGHQRREQGAKGPVLQEVLLWHDGVEAESLWTCSKFSPPDSAASVQHLRQVHADVRGTQVPDRPLRLHQKDPARAVLAGESLALASAFHAVHQVLLECRCQQNDRRRLPAWTDDGTAADDTCRHLTLQRNPGDQVLLLLPGRNAVGIQLRVRSQQKTTKQLIKRLI